MSFLSKLFKPRRVQTKVLTTADTGGGEFAAACSFNNLTIGKKYRLSGIVYLRANIGGAGDATVNASFTNGSQTLALFDLTGATAAGAGVTFTTSRVSSGFSVVFTATSADLDAVATSTSATSSIFNSTSTTVRDGTWVQLEELHDVVETAAWT